MRQVLPVSVDAVDVDAFYVDVERRPPRGQDRPWLLINMISSLDGGTNVGGVSGGLGGAADKLVFHTLRSMADAIVVAAGTARADNYGPPRLAEERVAQRTARGQRSRPRLVVVSGRLDLDPKARLFDDPEQPPLLITSERSDPDRRAALGEVAEVWVVGDERVELDAALARLHTEVGVDVALCEGGPSLNGALLELGAIDELCLTVAPTVTGGDSRRIIHAGGLDQPVPFTCAHVLEEEAFLFLRYVRDAVVPA